MEALRKQYRGKAGTRLCALRQSHLYTKKGLDGKFYGICILSQFFKLRNKKRLDVSGEAFWNCCSLHWPVSKEEIKGTALLSPSHLLFLIGQKLSSKVLSPLNFRLCHGETAAGGTNLCLQRGPSIEPRNGAKNQSLCSGHTGFHGQYQGAHRAWSSNLRRLRWGALSRWRMSRISGTLLSKQEVRQVGLGRNKHVHESGGAVERRSATQCLQSAGTDATGEPWLWSETAVIWGARILCDTPALSSGQSIVVAGHGCGVDRSSHFLQGKKKNPDLKKENSVHFAMLLDIGKMCLNALSVWGLN